MIKVPDSLVKLKQNNNELHLSPYFFAQDQDSDGGASAMFLSWDCCSSFSPALDLTTITMILALATNTTELWR